MFILLQRVWLVISKLVLLYKKSLTTHPHFFLSGGRKSKIISKQKKSANIGWTVFETLLSKIHEISLTMIAYFKYHVISGDSQNNWSSHGAENEPFAFQPTQHAEGGPTDEQAKSPEHPET